MLRGLYQSELRNKIGLSEGAIRHYETGIRTPKQPLIEAIAEALDVSPLALRDYGVESVRDFLGLLLQLEDDFGIAPSPDGTRLLIMPDAKNAPKMVQMLRTWAEQRELLNSGEITAEEYCDWRSKF